ncbi:unnamed protein product [Didymodactylos carnosus]|uniref:Uncharacterized protein n=1 Tax=Didymodactylos carnosus TaxID=1234261 RepID=A0A815XW39_9BILA|nr:unnamed protein product [Didymodactylos carnosus]CAF1562338.1 unnamed protein product [Didymodactylos carnosus]CAF4016759.1 unnamed protein product [Didymodactylos carnosus]CAF4423869.1 unnamed protein product [Didymodactylos carnosus]
MASPQSERLAIGAAIFERKLNDIDKRTDILNEQLNKITATCEKIVEFHRQFEKFMKDKALQIQNASSIKHTSFDAKFYAHHEYLS